MLDATTYYVMYAHVMRECDGSGYHLSCGMDGSASARLCIMSGQRTEQSISLSEVRLGMPTRMLKKPLGHPPGPWPVTMVSVSCSTLGSDGGDVSNSSMTPAAASVQSKSTRVRREPQPLSTVACTSHEACAAPTSLVR